MISTQKSEWVVSSNSHLYPYLFEGLCFLRFFEFISDYFTVFLTEFAIFVAFSSATGEMNFWNWFESARSSFQKSYFQNFFSLATNPIMFTERLTMFSIIFQDLWCVILVFHFYWQVRLCCEVPLCLCVDINFKGKGVESSRSAIYGLMQKPFLRFPLIDLGEFRSFYCHQSAKLLTKVFDRTNLEQLYPYA